MHVEADFDRCEANAICVGLAPDVFDLDDNEELTVASGPVPAHLEEAVRDAIVQCPRAALRETLG
ncbi:ferredoxin [Rhodococcus sp. Q]|uniref:ferredoxin n=1 Tax=Rhodococcus sp. Q TaxID=2502252 RepID=UPI0010F5CC7F|nr:ferredoxin [Rhodococcus sp. Q]